MACQVRYQRVRGEMHRKEYFFVCRQQISDNWYPLTEKCKNNLNNWDFIANKFSWLLSFPKKLILEEKLLQNIDPCAALFWRIYRLRSKFVNEFINAHEKAPAERSSTEALYLYRYNIVMLFFSFILGFARLMIPLNGFRWIFSENMLKFIW